MTTASWLTEGKQWQQLHLNVTAAVDSSCHCSYWGGIFFIALQCTGIIAAVVSAGENPLAATCCQQVPNDN